MISFNTEDSLIYLFSLISSGFRSRVYFFSVLNPTKIVTYISEVLDAGLLGPLFKVVTPSVPILCFNIVS